MSGDPEAWIQVMRDLVEYAKYLENMLWEEGDDAEDQVIVTANALLAEYE